MGFGKSSMHAGCIPEKSASLPGQTQTGQICAAHQNVAEPAAILRLTETTSVTWPWHRRLLLSVRPPGAHTPQRLSPSASVCSCPSPACRHPTPCSHKSTRTSDDAPASVLEVPCRHQLNIAHVCFQSACFFNVFSQLSSPGSQRSHLQALSLPNLDMRSCSSYWRVSRGSPRTNTVDSTLSCPGCCVERAAAFSAFALPLDAVLGPSLFCSSSSSSSLSSSSTSWSSSPSLSCRL